eukprot:9482093-Pyramimonas_sp.AAC.1
MQEPGAARCGRARARGTPRGNGSSRRAGRSSIPSHGRPPAREAPESADPAGRGQRPAAGMPSGGHLPRAPHASAE